MGDALGVPVEGMGRDEFEPVTNMRGGGSHGQPPGTWSQSGSTTLLTIESLLEKGGLDEADLGDRLVRWLFNRHWTARRVTFAHGFTTREAIVRIREGKRVGETGLADEESNGNGSLVRALPIVLFAHGRGLAPRETIDLVHRASKMTHAHPRAQLACGLYSFIVRALLEGKSVADALESMREKAAEHYASDPWNQEYRAFQRLMERDWRFVERSDLDSSGYVVHTLEAALFCAIRHATPREALLEATNLGGDADSVAAVTGSLVGARDGAGALPEEWRAELARIDEIESLLARFCDALRT
jgi:ADP-ribosylglycohydrolase